MLSKHFTIISTLLLQFIGTAFSCYNTGIKFEDIGGSEDITNAIKTFCEQHRDAQFAKDDKASLCVDFVKDGHARRLDMEIKFTEFPSPFGAANLTFDVCKDILSDSKGACNSHGGKEIKASNGMSLRKKTRGDSVYGVVKNAFDAQSEHEDPPDGATPQQESQHQNQGDSDGQDQEENETHHGHAMTSDSHNGSMTTTTAMKNTTLFSTIDPPQTVFITSFITKTKGKKYKTKTKTKTKTSTETEMETETQITTETITKVVTSTSSTSTTSTTSSTSTTSTISTSCSGMFAKFMSDYNKAFGGSGCGPQPPASSTSTASGTVITTITSTTTPTTSSTSTPWNGEFKCEVRLDPNDGPCSIETPQPQTTPELVPNRPQ